MTGGIVIEPFLQQSADQIFQLILPIQREEFGIPVTREDQPDLEDIGRFYQNGAGNFWVAMDQGVVVGTIALKDIENNQVALRKMFVHPNYRGKDKRIGQMLLDQALRASRDNKVLDIFLGTTSQFLAAHRFYEKNGFIEINPEHLPSNFLLMKIDSKFYHYKLY